MIDRAPKIMLDPVDPHKNFIDIRDAIDDLTPNDCRSYFTAAGYEPE